MTRLGLFCSLRGISSKNGIKSERTAEPSHRKRRRWRSMLINEGWFPALYTQHLLDSQSFGFELCTLQALNMPLIRCTNVFFPREAIPPYYYPLREDSSRVLSSRVLAWGLHGQGNPGLAVVIIPPLPPNVTNSRAKPQQTPSVEKHANPPRVVYCAIYSTLTRFTKFRV